MAGVDGTAQGVCKVLIAQCSKEHSEKRCLCDAWILLDKRHNFKRASGYFILTHSGEDLWHVSFYRAGHGFGELEMFGEYDKAVARARRQNHGEFMKVCLLAREIPAELISA